MNSSIVHWESNHEFILRVIQWLKKQYTNNDNNINNNYEHKLEIEWSISDEVISSQVILHRPLEGIVASGQP